ISVGNLFLGAILPGLLLSCLYFAYILVVSSLKPHWAPSLSDDVGPDSTVGLLLMLLKGFLPPVFLITLVLGSIFAGWATPTEAAGVGGFGSLVLALVNGKLKWDVVRDVCERTALTTGMIFFIFMGATAFSYVFRSLGGEDIIIELIEHLGLEAWGLLFVLMGTIFVLGFFFDWIEITLIVLPVFTPIVELMDFGSHVEGRDIVYWFAILVAVNLQTSFLTPPFGFALFYLKGVSPNSVKIQNIYRGIIPFVALQVMGLVACMIWPEITLWLPKLVLD
ncbi:MAG: TRAP transporter large permease subunit, partial [Thalassobaculum sp.]